MQIKKNSIGFILLGLIFISFNFNLVGDYNQIYDSKNIVIKSSDDEWTKDALYRINNSQDWLIIPNIQGNGSVENPYLIEDQIFDGNRTYKNIFYVENSSVNVIFENCTFMNASYSSGSFPYGAFKMQSSQNILFDNCSFNRNHGTAGIFGNNCTNITINNSLFNDSNNHIYLTYCKTINLVNNNLFDCINKAIILTGCSNGTVISNYIQDGLYGITIIYNTSHIFIADNIIKNVKYVGILFYRAEASSFISIVNNSIVGCESGSGIRLHGNYQKVSNNHILNNFENGIELASFGNCSHSIIENNHFENNGYNGIYLISCINTSIRGNFISNNARNGINIQYSHNTTIEDNKIESNLFYGIFAVNSTNLVIRNNEYDSNQQGDERLININSTIAIEDEKIDLAQYFPNPAVPLLFSFLLVGIILIVYKKEMNKK